MAVLLKRRTREETGKVKLLLRKGKASSKRSFFLLSLLMTHHIQQINFLTFHLLSFVFLIFFLSPFDFLLFLLSVRSCRQLSAH